MQWSDISTSPWLGSVAYCSKMDIEDLKYLAASVRAGNFSGAAKSLGVTTSTISRRIGRLEDELGLTLFERDEGGGSLSQKSAWTGDVYAHVRRALAELEAVKHAGDQNGSISPRESGHWCECRQYKNPLREPAGDGAISILNGRNR